MDLRSEDEVRPASSTAPRDFGKASAPPPAGITNAFSRQQKLVCCAEANVTAQRDPDDALT
jgi:hypothetical protein